MLLNINNFNNDITCNEYIIEREPFSITRWMILTTVFSLPAFYYELYSNDLSLLSVVTLFLISVLLMRLYYRVKEESLLVMASIGIQITTKFIFGNQVSTFIHSQNVKDIAIVEGVKVHRVLFYLAVFVKSKNSSEESIIPLFQYTLPPLKHLQRIYQGVQYIIFKNNIVNCSNL